MTKRSSNNEDKAQIVAIPQEDIDAVVGGQQPTPVEPVPEVPAEDDEKVNIVAVPEEDIAEIVEGRTAGRETVTLADGTVIETITTVEEIAEPSVGDADFEYEVEVDEREDGTVVTTIGFLKGAE